MSLVKDKVVVIVGASSGIGEATVRKLAQEGAKLVIGARRTDRLEKLAQDFPTADINYLATEVTEANSVKALVDLAVHKHGRIDVLFNNAGIMPLSNLAEARHDQWRAMVDVNIIGVLNGIAAALPVMKNQKSGHIITTDSVGGHYVVPTAAVYCGTKFAVRAIMEGLRQEERENGIRSTIVSPGTVNTELYKSIGDQAVGEFIRQVSERPGEGLTPEQVADAVAYVINTPETVVVSEILIRPSRQAM